MCDADKQCPQLLRMSSTRLCCCPIWSLARTHDIHMGFTAVLALFQVSSTANLHGQLLHFCTCSVIAMHLCCCSKAVEFVLFRFKMALLPEGHSVCNMLNCDICLYRPHKTAMLEQGLDWCGLDWAVAAGGFKVAYQLVWPETLKCLTN